MKADFTSPTLLGPRGEIITGALEVIRVIVPPENIQMKDGKIHFTPCISVKLDWASQKPLERQNERQFVDAHGTEFYESELTLVLPGQEEESYTVTIKASLADGYEEDDAEADDGAIGEHEYSVTAFSEILAIEKAKDIYHDSYAIGVLDAVDFDIDAETVPADQPVN